MIKLLSPVLLAAGALLWPLPGSAEQNYLQASPMTHLLAVAKDATGPIVHRPVPAFPAPLKISVIDAESTGSIGKAEDAILRHLPNNAQGLRLAGEIGTSEWPVYLTKAQAEHPLKFQLGFLAAISDLPEASRLSVQINDQTIGDISIDAPHKVKTIAFDVPADLMKPGFNSLRIVAQQHHRADCSLSATYELWTQIDATQTGFLLQPSDISVTALGDLPALPPGPQGAMPIRAVLPVATNAASINRMLQLAQIVAIQGRFEQPLVDVADSLASGNGVNLAIGPHDEIVKLHGLEALPVPDGPELGFLAATAQRRATIFVTGRDQDETDRALERMAHSGVAQGTAQGLRAAQAFPGYKVEGGTRLKLRDLGVISQEFSGRLFRSSINIVMPPDFYPADYAKVGLELSGAYAPGLAPGAQIVVSINDKIAVGSSLAKTAGEVFKGRQIDLPLGMLRPGLNKVEIDAHLPMAADATCDPLAASTAKKRFLFLEDTEIVIPPIGRVAMSPNLAITATGGFPYANSKLVSHLYVPGPDPDTIGAAATLIARMALSTGTTIDFRISVKPPSVSDGSTLVVAAASTLQPAALAMAGLDPDAIAKIWKTRMARPDDVEKSPALSKYEALTQERIALQRNFPAECRMRTPRTKASVSASVSPATARKLAALPEARGLPENAVRTGNLSDQWGQTINGGGWFSWFSWPALPSASAVRDSWAARPYDWAAGWVTSAKDAVLSGMGTASVNVVDDNAGLLVAQKNHGDAGEGIWTIVTAPTPLALREGVACLVDPRVWSQLGGEVAALDTSEAKINLAAAQDARFITTQPLSFSNLRLIAAGWFSLNRAVYVAVILAMALLLASVTLLFVKNVGRRT